MILILYMKTFLLALLYLMFTIGNANIVDELKNNETPNDFSFVKSIRVPHKIKLLSRLKSKKDVIKLHHPYKYKKISINEIHMFNDFNILLGSFESSNIAIRCNKQTCDFFEENK